MKEENSYWDVLEELPKDWIIDKTAGSPIKNTVFITNGKSVFNGQKRALLRIKPQVKELISASIKINDDEKQQIKEEGFNYALAKHSLINQTFTKIRFGERRKNSIKWFFCSSKRLSN